MRISAILSGSMLATRFLVSGSFKLHTIAPSSGRLLRSQMSSAADTNREGRKLFDETINMLYDSKCNLCMHEVNMLAKMDKEGKIKFTDLEDPDYDGSNPVNGGVSYEIGMTKMHAVKQNGEVITGVAVFRELYDAVGMGWLYRFTEFPIIGPAVDSLYDKWAKYRTQLTRGEALDDIIARRNEVLAQKMKEKANSAASSCEAMKNL